MTDSFFVQCDAVNYRKGFLEVIGGIHAGMVNVETWQVVPETDISGLEPGSDRLSDRHFTGNVELELTPVQARSLAATLTAAADNVERQLDRAN
jgi:hypothetical protein